MLLSRKLVMGPFGRNLKKFLIRCRYSKYILKSSNDQKINCSQTNSSNDTAIRSSTFSEWPETRFPHITQESCSSPDLAVRYLLVFYWRYKGNLFFRRIAWSSVGRHWNEAWDEANFHSNGGNKLSCAVKVCKFADLWVASSDESWSSPELIWSEVKVPSLKRRKAPELRKPQRLRKGQI